MSYTPNKLLNLINNLEELKNPLIKLELYNPEFGLTFKKTFNSYYTTIKYITENPQLKYTVIEGEQHMEDHKDHEVYELGGEA